MRLVRLPIPRVNVVKRPSLRPHVSVPSAKSRKRSIHRSTATSSGKPAGRKSTVAEKLAYAMAAGMLLGLGYLVCSTAPGVAPVAPDSTVTSIENAQVSASDIDDYAPETTTEPAPSTACDPYVPAKYRLCSKPIDSSRYPLTAPKSKRSSKSSTSAPSVTTTTTVRKSVSATGAKSTTTTKSVKVTK